ncbi:MAG TPA: hypothetical protein VFB27_12990 [Opitutaceae bacterium]|nr:hypothetical protein [Opitutaceae bacterium]
MSFKTSLLSASISVAITGGALSWVYHRRAVEAARLRSANTQLLFKASELWQARVSSAAPITPTVSTENENGPAPAVASAPVLPPPVPSDYRNEGQSTPLATLQTFAWACDRGDVEAVKKMLYFDSAGRTKALAFMATLPASERTQWGSPEKMAAALLASANMHNPFPNAAVLETATVEQISPDRVRLRLPGTPKDRTEYQKTDGGWKYVVTNAMVDAYIARAKAAHP